MSILPRGENNINSLLVLLTTAVPEHSLSKIYADLCECCAQPVKTCERASRGRLTEDSQTKSANRFASLNLGASGSDFPPAETQPNVSCNGCARENAAVTANVEATPRLVDDDLSDAFEIRKEIQVY